MPSHPNRRRELRWGSRAPRPAPRWLGLLALAQGLASLAGAEPSSPDARARFMQRVEAAHFARDFDALAALRQRLEAGSGPGPAAGYETAYDLAYLLWRNAQLHYAGGDESERVALLDGARDRIEQALAARPADLEARILLGAILSALSNESPLARVRLGRRSYTLAVENLGRAPENPRALIQRGTVYLFAPAAFGGDLDAAIASFRSAHAQLSRLDAAPRWPSWGRTESAAYLGQALERAGRVAEARRVYREELAANPNAAWIRDELLPLLESRSGGGQ